MEDNENVLEEETEVDDTEEYDGDPEEENDATDEEIDGEFEYDDEGNIVIPDVEFDPDEDEDLTDGDDIDEEAPEEESKEEEPEDDESDGESEEVPAKEQKGEEDSPEEVPAEPDPRDAEIESLKRKLQRLESQGRDTLKKLGKENDDVYKGLLEIAAEAEGKPPAEYEAKRDQEEREQTARNMLQNQLYEAKAASDLKELHAAYPETQKYKHVMDLPPEIRRKFGEFRDMGLSAKQAYAAANPDGIRTDTATAVKKQSMHESKAHLKSSVPKASKDNSITMSKRELTEARELFPGMSDKKIQALYKTVNK